VLGVVAVAAVIGAAWLAANWFPGGSTTLGTEDVASADPGPEEQGAGTGGAVETVPTTQPSSPSPSPTVSSPSTQTSPSTTSLFASRDALYGRYVAILWSGVVPTDPAQDAGQFLEDELATYQAQFGAGVVAVDSDQFRSLRDGTVAVAYDGGFASAREAKVWCRANGFPGTQDCYGVVLSDDHSPDDRGDLIRTYDL
jgi:hypothetical protein